MTDVAPEGDLLTQIERGEASRQILDVRLRHRDSSVIAWLYDHGEVLGRRDDAEFSYLRVSLDPTDVSRLQRLRADMERAGG